MPAVTSPVTIFLIVLAIILFAPVILNRLKIPHIIGMIVAGVFVGPGGLHILNSDSSFAIFGQVGLLYLMFLAGLEIDLFHLKQNLRRGVVFGLLTFLIPMVIGIPTSIYLLGVHPITACLLAAMYASHTLISYPVAARFGLTKNPAVLIAVVGTIIAVFGALLVLATCVNIHETGTFHISGILWLFGKLALYAAGIIYLYPRLTRYFFKHYNEKVTQYVFVMVLVFFSAWLCGAIGLEPVLGAFLAGLVLNRYIPSQSALMNSIEFVGSALFIPYFLIGVGMMIDLSVIAKGNTLAVALVMLLIAIIGKWLPAWLAQRLYGMDADSRRLLFGLTTAHTAVALAVVTIGYNMFTPDGHRMMDETILNGTVLVILITCALAPIVTSRAAARTKVRMLSTDLAQTGQRSGRPTNMLVPVSNPITAGPLVDLALMLHPHRVSGYRLFALHVRNENTPSAKAQSEHALKLAETAAAGADTPVTALERYDMNTVTGILNSILERDINSVVMGMHRKETIIDSFFGSKVEQLVKATNCMVTLARCFIPLNTVTRIMVYVPQKAEFETGFPRWVRSLGNLAQQIGCRIIFCVYPGQEQLIRGVIRHERLGIRHEFLPMNDTSDFMFLSSQLLDDDLFVVVGARPNSLSYSSDMVELPHLLQRYFGRNNLCYIFPGQFGDETPLSSFTDPLGSDINVTPSPLWLALRSRLQRFSARFLPGNRRN